MILLHEKLIIIIIIIIIIIKEFILTKIHVVFVLMS